jgi:multidrug resistance protein, MATE family
VLLLHIVTNYVFFNVFGFGYVAAAVAYTLSRFYYFILQTAYIAYAGLGSRVWGRPSWKAFTQWRAFAALAYPSCIMRCLESFCFGAMTVIAGVLTHFESMQSFCRWKWLKICLQLLGNMASAKITSLFRIS